MLESWHVNKLDARFLLARLVSVCGGAIGLLVGVQLAVARWPFSGVAQGLLGAIGAVCLVVGALLFLRLSRAGWGLLVLGFFACLLQIASNAISLGDSNWNTAAAVVLLIPLGLGLFVGSVRSLIHDDTVGLWNKAERLKVFWEVRCEYHRKSCDAVILDISRTGCGVGTENSIPIGERIIFSGVYEGLRGEVIREFSLDKADTALASKYKHFYGVRFLKRLRISEISRYRREEESLVLHPEAKAP